jgi:hypothetical protein
VAVTTSLVLLAAKFSWQRSWAPRGSIAMHGRPRISIGVAESL